MNFRFPSVARAALGQHRSTQRKTPTGRDDEAELTAQQFRHVVGYLYLLDHPGDYEVVRQMLGHKSILTTMTFYAALDKRVASKKIGEFIARKRAELRGRLRKRKKNEAIV